MSNTVNANTGNFGTVNAKTVRAGMASIYIGNDRIGIGNHIKSTGGFLRILIGTSFSNAVEKMRILANGNVGIGTTNPQYSLEVVGAIKADAVVATKKICLPNGSDGGLSECFNYVCPGANGQWTLSQTICSNVLPPPTPTSTPPVVNIKPTLSLPFSNTIINRSRQSIDDIATNDSKTLEWGATGGGVSIKTVTLTFSGLAVAPAATFTNTATTFSSIPAYTFSVDLIDGGPIPVSWASTVQQICDPGTAKSCSVTFSPNALIPSGVRTKKVIVRVNSSRFTDNALQDSLSIKIKVATDITWSDGVTSNINWNPIEMPMTVANIYYP